MSARRLDTSSVRRSGTAPTPLSLLPADATEEPERSLLRVSELIVPPSSASNFGSGLADLRDFDVRASGANRRRLLWVRQRRDFGKLSALASEHVALGFNPRSGRTDFRDWDPRAAPTRFPI